MIEIIFEQPLWYFIPGTIVSGILTYWLYYKDSLLRERGRVLFLLLHGLRFLLLFSLVFLLLKPFIRTISTAAEKPIIAIAIDESESMVANADSAVIKQNVSGAVAKLQAELGDDFELDVLAFGDNVADVKYEFTQQTTDFSQLTKELDNRYSNRNLGAVVVMSDGIYNRGVSPIYAFQELKSLVYTVAIGDTVVKRDAAIKGIYYNNIAFIGNKFPVEVALHADKLKGQPLKVALYHNTELLEKKEITSTQDDFNAQLSFLIDAKTTGLQKYRVVIESIGNESNTKNNSTEFYIEILNNKQKILVLYAAPHPDIAAIREALSESLNNEITLKNVAEFSGSIESYNLVIAYHVPAVAASNSALNLQLKNATVPIWYFVGENSDVEGFNKLQNSIQIERSGGRTNSVTGQFTGKAFSLFTTDAKEMQKLQSLPPIVAPFGNYSLAPQVQALLNQRIGNVTASIPLWAFSSTLKTKLGFTLASGIWRWRTNLYKVEGDHAFFNGLVQKTAQYLSLKEDKKRFKVVSKNAYDENERIQLEAELYNKSFELVNEPDVNLTLTSETGESYQYVFGKVGNGYRLDAGLLTPGNYTFKATCVFDGETFNAAGEFLVKNVQLENLVTYADFNVLNSIALQGNGIMSGLHDIQKIIDDIKENKQPKSILFEQEKLEDLVNIKWLFFVLLAFVSLEWFLRRYNGVY